MAHLFSHLIRRTAGAALWLMPAFAYAQQGVGIGTSTPDPKAVLDISAADKGLLIPRLDSAQRARISSPPDGLLVFQKNGRVGLWYAFGGQWFFIPDKVRGADNLGNHVATRNLSLGGNALTGTGNSVSGLGVGVTSYGGLNLAQNTANNGFYIGYGAGAANTSGDGNHFVGYQAGVANTTGSYNHFDGYYSGTANTTGSHNYFSGYGTGTNNTTGTGNTFVGRGAGLLNTTGNRNVFVGNTAGQANTTGSFNQFIGYFAGSRNTLGQANHFSGYRAGLVNTEGSNNQFEGYNAGVSNTVGSNNFFLGYEAGMTSTAGSENHYVGYRAGRLALGDENFFEGPDAGLATTFGSGNYFSGRRAGRDNSSGFSNLFLGQQAGQSNTTASENCFVGNGAGFSNTTAGMNHFFGFQAGYSTTTGGNNFFDGYQAGYSNTTGNSNYFSGYQAGYANTVGTANHFVGSGAGSSNTTGNRNDFSGHQSGFSNTTGEDNHFAGYWAGLNSTTGSRNVMIGGRAGFHNSTGSNITLLGYQADVTTHDLTNAAAIGYNAQVSQNNSLVLGGTGADAVWVGIGTTAPAATLHVADTASTVRFAGLSGSATRMVVAAADGSLAAQPIPADAQQLSISGATISLTNGGSVTVPSSADNLGNHTAAQNLNLGTFQLVGNGGTSGLRVNANGTVRSPGFVADAATGYAYATAQPRYLTLTGASFRALNQRQSQLLFTGGSVNPFCIADGTNGTAAGAIGDLQLPQGATITAVSAVVYDNDSGAGRNVSLAIEQITMASLTNVQVASSATTSGAPGQTTLTMTPNLAIDNSLYAYRIRFNTIEANPALRLLSVRITYTISRVE